MKKFFAFAIFAVLGFYVSAQVPESRGTSTTAKN